MAVRRDAVEEPALRLVVERGEGGAVVVALVGELDCWSAPALRERLTQIVDEGATSIALDVSKLVFVDSTGLGVLIGATKRARAHDCSLVLRSPTSATERVLEITGLHHFFDLERPRP